ncbi:ATP-dependent DNA helicase pif1-like [Daktulosphaira vitifoliae]|uniref:ATP-dependent DNA helicase pif1-like n=1 Tax=Daktulosphaira vitifoliae TaxID=58002 RepID=UPI0021AAF60C|nr:ATP-dependent DNA helicase pif1-like [Daktulosphaira vitifoliae]
MQLRKAQALRAASLIVWNEASMSPTSQLRVADRLLRDVMNVPDTHFGGKLVLFAGDFRQTLPIVKRGSRAQIVSATIRHGVYWVLMEKYALERNMRADGLEHVTIPGGAVSESFVSLLDFVYPRAMSLDNVRDYAKHIVLCVTNNECKNINDQVLHSRVTGSQRVYTATDAVIADDDDEAANFLVEFLNTLEADNLPPYRLTLKVGAIVMLLKNLDTARRLCNGTRLVITELRQHNFKAKLLKDLDAEETVVPIVQTRTSGDGDIPCRMCLYQFPVRLCYAMTNKSQGQTFDRIGLSLTVQPFAHGQLYVAFLRVRNQNSIRVYPLSAVDGPCVVKNVLYREVLE